MSFEALLAELDAAQTEQSTLAKSLEAEMPKDDEVVIPPKKEDEEDEEGKELMTKSMVLDGGEEVTLVDAEAMLKSLNDIGLKQSATEALMVKGLQASMAMIKSQGEMIKSLNARLDTIGGQGAGRKTVLSVVEKPTAGAETALAKSQGQELTVPIFMAKSHAAFEAKKITGKELTTIDVAARTNQLSVLDNALINKVLG